MQLPTEHALAQAFWNAHLEALFAQDVIAAVRGCSVATLERDRKIGGGIPFRKLGHAVRYKKADVVAWLSSCPPYVSTSEYCASIRRRTPAIKA